MLGFHNGHWTNSTLEICFIFTWIFCCCSDFTWTPFPQGTFLPQRLFTFSPWLLSVFWFFVLHIFVSFPIIFRIVSRGRSSFGAAGPFTNFWSDCEQLTDNRCSRCRLDWQATGCAGFLGLLRDTRLLTVPPQKPVNFRGFSVSVYKKSRRIQRNNWNPSPLLSHSFTSAAHTPISPSTGVATGMQRTSKT